MMSTTAEELSMLYESVKGNPNRPSDVDNVHARVQQVIRAQRLIVDAMDCLTKGKPLPAGFEPNPAGYINPPKLLQDARTELAALEALERRIKTREV